MKILVVASLVDILFEFLVIRQLSGQDFWLLFFAVMILVISGFALLITRSYELRAIKRRWKEGQQQ